jgi:hypothetical protein
MGSTALSTRTDPGELRDVISAYKVHISVGSGAILDEMVISAYQAARSKVIQIYDGLVANFMRDGLVSYFGYPGPTRTMQSARSEQGARATQRFVNFAGIKTGHSTTITCELRCISDPLFAVEHLYPRQGPRKAPKK